MKLTGLILALMLSVSCVAAVEVVIPMLDRSPWATFGKINVTWSLWYNGSEVCTVANGLCGSSNSTINVSGDYQHNASGWYHSGTLTTRTGDANITGTLYATAIQGNGANPYLSLNSTTGSDLKYGTNYFRAGSSTLMFAIANTNKLTISNTNATLIGSLNVTGIGFVNGSQVCTSGNGLCVSTNNFTYNYTINTSQIFNYTLNYTVNTTQNITNNITYNITSNDGNNYTNSLSLSTVTQYALNATLQRQGMTDLTAGVNTLNLYLNASKVWVGIIPDARLDTTITRDSEVPSLETDANHDTCAEIGGCVVGAITDGNTNWDNTYGLITNDVTVNIASDTLTLTNLNTAGYSDVQFKGSDANYKGSTGCANPSASYFPGQCFAATGGYEYVIAPGLNVALRANTGGDVNITDTLYTQNLCIGTDCKSSWPAGGSVVNNYTFNYTINTTQNTTIVNNFTYDATELIRNVSNLNVSLEELRSREALNNQTQAAITAANNQSLTTLWNRQSNDNTTLANRFQTVLTNLGGNVTSINISLTTLYSKQSADNTTLKALIDANNASLSTLWSRQAFDNSSLLALVNANNASLTTLWNRQSSDNSSIAPRFTSAWIALAEANTTAKQGNTTAQQANQTATQANTTATTALSTAQGKASPGNCAYGEVVENITTSGVQCTTDRTGVGGPAAGDGTGGWTNNTVNTDAGYLNVTTLGRITAGGYNGTDSALRFWASDSVFQRVNAGNNVFRVALGIGTASGSGSGVGFYLTNDPANPTTSGNSDFGMLSLDRGLTTDGVNMFVSSTGGNQLLLENIAYRTAARNHQNRSYPMLYIHSNTFANESYFGFGHNGTDAVIESGLGEIHFTNSTHILGDLKVTSLSAANCDVKSYQNGTLYCGTDNSGGSDPSAWTNYTKVRYNATTTTPSAITEFSTPLTAGLVYSINCNLIYVGNTTVTSGRLKANATGTFTHIYHSCETSTSGTARYQQGSISANLACDSTASIGNNLATPMHYQASINSSSGGVFNMYWLSEAAGAWNLLQQGSYCEFKVI